MNEYSCMFVCIIDGILSHFLKCLANYLYYLLYVGKQAICVFFDKIAQCQPNRVALR